MRVVIMGASAGFRAGVEDLLGAGGARHLVVQCDNPASAIAAVESIAGEVLIVDADGLGAAAGDLAEMVTGRIPGVAVLILSLGADGD